MTVTVTTQGSEHLERNFASKEKMPVYITRYLFWVVILPGYLLSGMFLLPHYQYQINPDGVSYLSIAQKYLNGHWHEAISSHWSPLFSWLLVPFLFFKTPALLSSKIISLGAGVLALIQMRLFFKKLNISDKLSLVSLGSFIPVLLRWVCYVISPDLLLVPILLGYLYFTHLFKWKEKDSLAKGLVCGVLGGLAYLCKAYTFFFFLLHYSFVGLLYDHFQDSGQKRRAALKSFTIGLTVFLLISGSWASVIYKKYHRLSISTASEFVFSLVLSQTSGYPMFTQGLLPLPNDASVSFWDDPRVLRAKEKGEKSFRDKLFLHMTAVPQNFRSAEIYFRDISPFLPIFFLLGILLVLPPFRSKAQAQLACLMAALGLYVTGYLFIRLEERYVWISITLMAFVSGYVLDWLIEKSFPAKVQQVILLLFYALSVVIYPCKYLYLNLNRGSEMMSVNNSLIALNVRGNIAADPGNWQKGLYASYFSGSRFYGVPKSRTLPQDVERELLAHDIDYYLIFNKNTETSQFRNYKELEQENSLKLKVLKRI